MTKGRFASARAWAWLGLHVILVLLGVIFAMLDHAWAVAVGTSLIATGIAGLVIFLYIAQTERVELALENLTRFGLWEVFDGRSTRIREQYDARCERMRDQLDIMGFGLSSFLEDHKDDLQQWRHRANIRILVIDPYFPTGATAFADQRDREERKTAGSIREQVLALENALRPLIGQVEGRSFAVRRYQCLPSVNIFRVDDDLFWGPYLMHQPSRNSPTMLVRRGGILFQRLTEHFDAIWNSDDLSSAI